VENLPKKVIFLIAALLLPCILYVKPSIAPFPEESAGDLAPMPDTFVTVMEMGTTGWDTAYVRTPFVLLDGDLYKMWYTAINGPGPWPLSWAIAYAESLDGVAWYNRQVVHYAGPASTYYEASWPWVLKEDGVYRMWHMDYNGVDGWTGFIAHMTSTNGVAWPAFMSEEDVRVLSPLNQHDPQGDGYDLKSPCVIHETGGYVMWYATSDLLHGEEAPAKIWRTTSTDGIVWSNRQLSLPYIPDTWEGNIQESCVVKEDDGTYTIFYSALNVDSQFIIGVARSTDGITWTGRRQLLRASDLGVDVSFPEYALPGAFHFGDADGKRYLYFSFLNVTDGKKNIGRVQLGPQLPYDVNIDSYCYAEDAAVSVSITMDGTPTGYSTPHTFTGMTGSHTFTVPNMDINGHLFQQWNSGLRSTTITIGFGGTYTAYYGVMYALTITTTTGGTTSLSPGTHYHWAGTAVSVTASSYTDYTFDYWELDSVNVGSTNPIIVTMDQNHNLHAVFVYVGGLPGVPEFPDADISILTSTFVFLVALYLTVKRKKKQTQSAAE
jgi:hypothetical protein